GRWGSGAPAAGGPGGAGALLAMAAGPANGAVVLQRARRCGLLSRAPGSLPGVVAMRLPSIRGVIDRRILVNYRVAPDVLARLLPAPFRPRLVHGFGMVGICLIRLREVRPALLPAWLGIASENAAHRAAVESD